MKEFTPNKTLKNIIFSEVNFLFVLLFMTTIVWGQNDKTALERRKQQILKEIEVAERLLKTGREEEKSVLNQIEQQVAKIRLRENLIETNERKKIIYESEIEGNQKQLGSLHVELQGLKKDYANIVLKSFKSRSEKSRLMFVLSSKNFLQAYKRLQYMKQYADFRKQRGEEIKMYTNKLITLNQLIALQKKEKEVLIETNIKEIQTFEKEKEEKTELVQSLKKEQKKIADEIRKKHKESMVIEERIEKLIRESIIAANKKAAALAAAKAAAANSVSSAGSPVKVPVKTTDNTVIKLTPEAKTLSDGFRYNKGRLPWPVEKGLVTKRFGMQPHPVEKSIMIESNGVEITTERGGRARSVFSGQVIDIQLMPNNTAIVMIRHGDYTTVYSNVINLVVRKGDQVSIKQDLGQIHYNELLKKAVLKFLIYNNTFKQDPQHWIYNM
jgi:septal ring factor EnvC (AmiA/AmiB activator)